VRSITVLEEPTERRQIRVFDHFSSISSLQTISSRSSVANMGSLMVKHNVHKTYHIDDPSARHRMVKFADEVGYFTYPKLISDTTHQTPRISSIQLVSSKANSNSRKYISSFSGSDNRVKGVSLGQRDQSTTTGGRRSRRIDHRRSQTDSEQDNYRWKERVRFWYWNLQR